MGNPFYRYTEKDFITIQAKLLRKGDRIAYSSGGGGRYGIAELNFVTVASRRAVVICYNLPAGARVVSSEKIEVTVDFIKGQVVVSVEERLEWDGEVMVVDG